MKKYWQLVKDKITDYVVYNWNTDGYFNKGKLIFIGVTLFFILWKLLYNLFV